MTPARTWAVHSAMHLVSWRNFASEEHAWRFLFGRESNQAEREDYLEAGWVVDQHSEHPSERRLAA